MEEVIIGKNFFNKDEIKILESYENGATYILFYLKLLSLTAKTGNKLCKYKSIDYLNYSVLATLTNTDVNTVEVALKKFESLNIVRKELVNDKEVIFLEKI